MDSSGRARTCIAVVLALAVALVVTACGGGGSPTASSRAPTPVAEAPPRSAGSTPLVQAADAICRRLNAEILIPADARDLPKSVSVVPHNEALELRAVSELGKLTPAPALAHEWARFLARRRTLATQLGALAADVRRGDASAERALIAAKKGAHGAMRAIATRMGLSDCSRID
jgi:hypothetical protein